MDGLLYQLQQDAIFYFVLLLLLLLQGGGEQLPKGSLHYPVATTNLVARMLEAGLWGNAGRWWLLNEEASLSFTPTGLAQSPPALSCSQAVSHHTPEWREVLISGRIQFVLPVSTEPAKSHKNLTIDRDH